MEFKIVLTVLFLTEILISGYMIDEPRKPISAGEWIIKAIMTSILIFGIWNWA